MTKQNRVFSMLMAGIIAFALLFSVAFITVEANHDCSGDNCPICQQINTCQNILDGIALAGAAAGFVAALLHILYKLILPYTEDIPKITLVSLKVKLLN